MPEGGAGSLPALGVEGGERIPQLAQLSLGRVAACLSCVTLEKGPFALLAVRGSSQFSRQTSDEGYGCVDFLLFEILPRVFLGLEMS